MTKTRAIGLLVSVVGLALWLNTACAPVGTWEKYNEAGFASLASRDDI